MMGIVHYDLGANRDPCAPRITPILPADVELESVAKRFGVGPLAVYARYRSGLYPQLATLDEITRFRGYTGATPTVIARSW